MSNLTMKTAPSSEYEAFASEVIVHTKLWLKRANTISRLVA
jgi:hypothetical protein